MVNTGCIEDSLCSLLLNKILLYFQDNSIIVEAANDVIKYSSIYTQYKYITSVCRFSIHRLYYLDLCSTP